MKKKDNEVISTHEYVNKSRRKLTQIAFAAPIIALTTLPVSAQLTALAPLTALDISDLAGATQINEGQQVLLKGWHPESTLGGGTFVWDANGNKAEHNGGTIIDPSINAPIDFDNPIEISGYLGTSGYGTGVFRRLGANPINVFMFGAYGDKLRDDAAQIQAAIDFVGLKGGVVKVPSGYTFKTDSTVTIGRGVRLVGEGRSTASSPQPATKIAPTHNDPVIELTGAWASVEKMTIAHSGNPAGGVGVRGFNAADVSARELYIVGCWNGLEFESCNTPVGIDLQVINCKGDYSFKIFGGTAGNSDSFLLDNISGGFTGDGSIAEDDFTHLLLGDFTNSGKVLNYRFVRGDYGIRLLGSEDGPDDIWFLNGGCDNQVKDGVRFHYGQNIFITDMWIGQSGEVGVVFAGGFTGNVSAKALRIRGSKKHGLHISGGSNLHFSDSMIGQNGNLKVDTYHGVVIQGNVSKVTFHGGTIGELEGGDSNVQKYGIVIKEPVNHVRVLGVNLSGNLAPTLVTSTGNDIDVITNNIF